MARAATPPPTLNDRQLLYLKTAYQLDQQNEEDNKHNYHRGIQVAASEWRFMPYGRWKHLPGEPPTQLRQLIEQAAPEGKRVVDPGTGSTWKALAERGLIEIEHRVVVNDPHPRIGYSLPYLQLTRAGRVLVRQLTGEVRPKAPARKPKPKQPEGLLTSTLWLALAQVYRLDYEGLPADDIRLVSFGRISYHIYWILRERGLVIGSPDEQFHAEKYTITEQGRTYYHQYFVVNTEAYHRVDELPRPVLTAEQRAFWQHLRELNSKMDFAGPVETTRKAIKREILEWQSSGAVGALFFADNWYMALEGRAIAINPGERPKDCPFATKAEALARVQEKIESWKKQALW